jgi:hypothetical protein|uniref:Uncharacterized protein n=2 Tax=unclassified Caudoviricetes TaxID=2788787 RepID=A0A8S5U2M4_9CAUD|nr:MAG TPA: protein of unknown function (DUF1815) [Podoviridae sp. cte242]DAF88708.1 MAG TPA: protein of unknown function (DUF1815) [Podoviridae sp. ctCDM29]
MKNQVKTRDSKWISITAAKLYHWGWRSSDGRELMKDFGFTWVEMLDICAELEMIDCGIRPTLEEYEFDVE